MSSEPMHQNRQMDRFDPSCPVGVHSSKYNLYLADDDKFYVFNTHSGALVSLNENVFLELKDGRVEAVDPAYSDTLRDLGIITTSENEFRDVYAENERCVVSKNDFAICITPTFRCNAGCEYCFERGIAAEDMSEGTFQAIIEYIKVHNGGNSVHITWFGGEPLLVADKITRFCEMLKANNIRFVSTTMTNGYLLDRVIDDIVGKWNLRKVQITLDALHKEYNVVKKLGEDGFEKVVSNIHLAVERGIKVTVRVNYDSEHHEGYKELIHFVHHEFGNNVHLYFHDIIGQEFLSPNEISPNPLLEIYDELITYGYIKNLADMRIKRVRITCGIHKSDFINVCPDGNATKCEHYVGRESEFSLGNIKNRSFDPGKVFCNLTPSCAQCICFPLCGGGCLSNHKIRRNGGCVRFKNDIDKFILLYIRRLYHGSYVG